VQTLHGDSVLMPDMTVEEYDRVRVLAEAGDIRAPEIVRFIQAFAVLVGHDLGGLPWGDHDTVGFLKWLGFLPEAEWTAADDAGLTMLLKEGMSDGR